MCQSRQRGDGPAMGQSLAHAEDGTIKKNVFAAGEFRVEAGADFEE